jgi:hypothetical protein
VRVHREYVPAEGVDGGRVLVGLLQKLAHGIDVLAIELGWDWRSYGRAGDGLVERPSEFEALDRVALDCLVLAWFKAVATRVQEGRGATRAGPELGVDGQLLTPAHDR